VGGIEEALGRRRVIVIETPAFQSPAGIYPVNENPTGPRVTAYIYFKVDGRPVIGQWLGFAGWEQLSVNVPAGQHTVAVVVEPTGRPVTTLVDQASWSPGQRLPAAVAVGDADGFWVHKGVWEKMAGAARDGTGDAATVQHAGGSGGVHLLRLLDTPSIVRYWHKIETDTPDSYFGPEGWQTPGVWVQSSDVVTSSGTADKPLFSFGLTALSHAGPAKAFLDDVEIIPLTLTKAVHYADLSSRAFQESTFSTGLAGVSVSTSPSRFAAEPR
jgi:hypothetical protein